jgi:hypothetical protein
MVGFDLLFLVARVTRTEVQSLELDAGVGGVVLISLVLPWVDFVGEDLLVGDADTATRTRQVWIRSARRAGAWRGKAS